MPEVSVVVPTYNRLPLLRRALASCFEGNDGADVEAVVVDDGSTDGTREWLSTQADPRVRPVLQEHAGGQAARNRGLDAARGAFVTFLDDDDLLAPGALADMAAALRSSGADVCYGDFHWRDADGSERVVRQRRDGDLAANVMDGSVSTPPHGSLYRRAFLLDHGLRWEPSTRFHQDFAFAVAAACAGPRAVAVDRGVGTVVEHGGARVTDERGAAVRAAVYAGRAEIILGAVEALRRRGALSPRHLEAAGEGAWAMLHLISGYDLRAFSALYRRVRPFAPRPPHRPRLLRALDGVLGVRATEYALYPLRRAKRAVRERRL